MEGGSHLLLVTLEKLNQVKTTISFHYGAGQAGLIEHAYNLGQNELMKTKH